MLSGALLHNHMQPIFFMELKKWQLRPEYHQDKKLSDRFEIFNKLINELQQKELPEELTSSINQDIDGLNTFSGSANELLKHVRKTQSRILKMLEKQLKLVVKNHYRNMWLAFGMSGLGIPVGVAIGMSAGNIGLLGLGFPIGMGIGVVVGSIKDKKAKDSGKQLDVEIKYLGVISFCSN